MKNERISSKRIKIKKFHDQKEKLFINYAEKRAGPNLIILIHGLANNWRSWEYFMNQNSEFFSFISIDLLGFGHSSRHKVYTSDLQVRGIMHFIKDYLKNKKFDSVGIAGLSMSTLIVQKISTFKPREIDYYILMNPSVRSYKNQTIYAIFRYVLFLSRRCKPIKFIYEKTFKTKKMSYFLAKRQCYKFDKELIDKIGIKGKSLMDFNAFIDMGYELTKFDFLKEIKKASNEINFLILFGENDKLIEKNELNKKLKKIIKHRLRIKIGYIPNCAHGIPYENPKYASEKIKSYILSIKKGGLVL